MLDYSWNLKNAKTCLVGEMQTNLFNQCIGKFNREGQMTNSPAKINESGRGRPQRMFTPQNANDMWNSHEKRLPLISVRSLSPLLDFPCGYHVCFLTHLLDTLPHGTSLVWRLVSQHDFKSPQSQVKPSKTPLGPEVNETLDWTQGCREDGIMGSNCYAWIYL